jgi:hypothetical protein
MLLDGCDWRSFWASGGPLSPEGAFVPFVRWHFDEYRSTMNIEQH